MKKLNKDQDIRKDMFIPEPISGRYDEQVEDAWDLRLSDLPSKAIPLLALLDVASTLVGNFHHKTLKGYGHNHTEYAILCTLLLNGAGMRPSVLTGMLGKPSAGTAQTLNKLEKKGLVVREENPDDGRSVLVALTKEGEDVTLQLCEAEASSSRRLTKHLSNKEILELRLAMEKIIDIFN